MTDLPAALAFATNITKNPDQPLVAYAAVYPLVMILRVFIVQVLILTLPMSRGFTCEVRREPYLRR